MDRLDLQLLILDSFRFEPFRGPFPKLLKVLGLELTDMETAASIATHIHDPEFQAELYGQLNYAMWLGKDGQWRVIDLVHLKPRNVPRGFCSLCRIDEDDRAELIKACDGCHVHHLCLQTYEQRLKEVISNEQ